MACPAVRCVPEGQQVPAAPVQPNLIHHRPRSQVYFETNDCTRQPYLAYWFATITSIECVDPSAALTNTAGTMFRVSACMHNTCQD